MRIAQVSPLYESVPPKLYGGTERIVSYLTEELAERGHEVTLFATGDSVTSTELVSIRDVALRSDNQVTLPIVHHLLMLERVFERQTDFDIIHFHVGYLHFPLSRIHREPHVTTLHERLDQEDWTTLSHEYQHMPVVAISNAQRAALPGANWQGTIHHGLPLDLYSLQPEPGDYLAFLGRIVPKKRVDRAIGIAIQLGMELRIAGRVADADRGYFESQIKPLLGHPQIEFVGEIGDDEKNEFLGNAYALLFLIDWPEPFGIVLLEAMACGTPVVAFGEGAVPEIIEHGVTGFIIASEENALEAIQNVSGLNRERCRQVFEQRFSAARMTLEYIEVYENILKRGTFTDAFGKSVHPSPRPK